MMEPILRFNSVVDEEKEYLKQKEQDLEKLLAAHKDLERI